MLYINKNINLINYILYVLHVKIIVKYYKD